MPCSRFPPGQNERARPVLSPAGPLRWDYSVDVSITKRYRTSEASTRS